MATTLALLIPQSATASLVSLDSSLGVGSLTYDTVSGLGWLDLNVTQGLSFQSVAAQLQQNGRLDGYRYATFSELDALMLNGGIPYRDGRQLYFGDAENAANLIALLGATAGGAGESQSIGMLGAPAYSWQAPEARAIGFIYYATSDVRFTSSPNYPFAMASPGGNATSVWMWDASASVGSFLVRAQDAPSFDIPEPDSMALLLLGLALFGVTLRPRLQLTPLPDEF